VASVLTYHKLGRSLELGLPAVSRKRLAAHLDLLASLARSLVWAREAASPARAGSIAVTFDDGYETVHTIALPEMAARGMVGTVFPVVGSIGGTNSWDVRLSLARARHLDWRELRDLCRQGFEIGSHTLSHRDLTRLGQDDLARELAGSKHLLEDRLGAEVVSIAYPFGKATARVVEAAARAGYRFGFGSDPVGPACDGPPEMRLGRMSVYGIDGRSSLLAKLGVGAGGRLETAKARAIAMLSRGTPLVKR
jgi:peptidoglycan/xylan/chitin deacetylase (PgdA/CDA1 family)